MLHWRLCLAIALLVPTLAPSLTAVAPQAAPLPVGSLPLPRGDVVPTGPPHVEGPPPLRVVDGLFADWVGANPGLAGCAVYSRGEYVYQDHLFDDRGADDGKDAKRLALLEPAVSLHPGAYRVDMLSQASGEELGADALDPTQGILVGKEGYGDAAYPTGTGGHADLLEVRVAAQGGSILLLVRTVTMRDANAPAILLLADTTEGGAERAVPFGSGIVTREAEVALLVARGRVLAADLVRGAVAPVPEARVAVSASGYVNAIEASIPRSLLEIRDAGGAPGVRIALAAGISDGASGLAPVATGEGRAHLLNVAFRREAEIRVRMDRAQALSLLDGTIDPFLRTIDLSLLDRGASVPSRPTPGYHERVFRSSPAISFEDREEGIHQHYGLHLPSRWVPEGRFPLTVWLHWAGGKAHSAAASTPRVMETLGDDHGSLVVSPRGRGATSWYVGVGHQDVLEALDDVQGAFAIDPARVYLAGYSMGGFGAYLFGMSYPDRFAAAYSVAGAVTQGGWVGLDLEGSDTQPVGGGDAKAELVRRLVENALHVPYVVHHGTNDQLVLSTGVARTMTRFTELGYRYRLYLFPGQEHYAQAILDEWAEGARFLHSHARPENPGHVVLKRVPAFERAVETIHTRGTRMEFPFGNAYWLSGMIARDADESDPRSFALADVRSRALPHEPIPIPEAGAVAPGHSAPYAMHGLRWIDGQTAKPENRFEADFTNVASVRLDLRRMALDTGNPIAADLLTDGDVALGLTADWGAAPRVLVNGAPVPARLEGNDLTLSLGPGAHRIRIGR